MGHNGNPYDYVIHVALTAQSRVSLITSFQPPLLPSLVGAWDKAKQEEYWSLAWALIGLQIGKS